MIEFLKKNVRWIILVIFLIISIQIFTYDVLNPPQPGIITRGILSVTSYPIRFIHGIRNSIADSWSEYIHLVGVKRDAEFLREKLSVLLEDNRKLRALKQENERLKKLLTFAEKEEYKIIPAKIIGVASDERNIMYLVDKGTSSGVTMNTEVFVPDGVVGRVFRASAKTAQIMLITNQRSFIDVRFERTRTRAILYGTGEDCAVDFVKREEDIVVGDSVITSGLGGVFVEKHIIGTVSNVETSPLKMFKNITVIPSAKLNKLEEVLLVSRIEGMNAAP